MKLTSSEIADMHSAVDKMSLILAEARGREAPAITAEDVRSIGVGTSLVTGDQQARVLARPMNAVEAFNAGVYAMGEQIIRQYGLEPEQDLEWQAANPSEAPGPVLPALHPDVDCSRCDHASDCDLHNEPALPNGPCTCSPSSVCDDCPER